MTLFEKDDILLALQEKANEKLETLRHDMAQSLFECLSVNEETYFVYDKAEEDVVAGPFENKAKAKSYVNDMEDSENLVVVTEKNLEKKLGIKI